MNLLLFHPTEAIAENRYALAIHDRRVIHLQKVLKLSTQDKVEAGVLHGALGQAIITKQNEQHWHFHFTPLTAPPPPLPITLILALPRPKMLRRTLLDAITLGIKHIILINSYKVEKSYWQTPRLQENQLHELMQLALEQAKDTKPASIEIKNRFKPFLEDDLIDIKTNKECYLLHPGNGSYLPQNENLKETIIAIGPEGGWSDYEVKRFIEMGFKQCSLGQRILRVETALPTVIGRLAKLP